MFELVFLRKLLKPETWHSANKIIGCVDLCKELCNQGSVIYFFKYTSFPEGFIKLSSKYFRRFFNYIKLNILSNKVLKYCGLFNKYWLIWLNVSLSFYCGK